MGGLGKHLSHEDREFFKILQKHEKTTIQLKEAIELLKRVNREGSYTLYDRIQKWLKNNE